MRSCLIWLLLCAPLAADINFQGQPSQTYYVKFVDTFNTGVDATPNAQQPSWYLVTDAQMQAAGLPAGNWNYTSYQGTAATHDEGNIRVWTGLLNWNGTATLPPVASVDNDSVAAAVWSAIVANFSGISGSAAEMLSQTKDNTDTTLTRIGTPASPNGLAGDIANIGATGAVAVAIGPQRTWIVPANSQGWRAQNIVEIKQQSQPIDLQFDMSGALNPGTVINTVTSVTDDQGTLTIGNLRKDLSFTKGLFDITGGLAGGVTHKITMTVTTTDLNTIAIEGTLRVQP